MTSHGHTQDQLSTKRLQLHSSAPNAFNFILMEAGMVSSTTKSVTLQSRAAMEIILEMHVVCQWLLQSAHSENHSMETTISAKQDPAKVKNFIRSKPIFTKSSYKVIAIQKTKSLILNILNLARDLFTGCFDSPKSANRTLPRYLLGGYGCVQFCVCA